MVRPRLEDLSLREKIGQMGVYRYDIEFLEKVKNRDKDLTIMGGIWIIGALNMKIINMSMESTDDKATAKSNWELMKSLNENMKIPLFGCMDCGGGINGQFHDMTKMVGSATIGAAGSAEYAYKIGTCKAKEMKCAGANWLWGPEVDLVSRFSSIGLGRKYSDDPELIIKLTREEIAGIQANGVAATAKHFPGEDEMEYRDPHTNETIMRLPVEEWKKRQGRVFKEVFDAGVYSVMIGHQSFPACDNTKIKGQYVPATVSYKVVTELLKGEMEFSGVVITDAIEMDGLYELFDHDGGKVCKACINAGCDVILEAPYDFIDVIEAAVINGEIEESRIDDACTRILDMKEKLGLFDKPLQEMNQEEIIRESAQVNQEIAENSLSLICDKYRMLPLNPEKCKRVAIIYSGYNEKVYQSLEIMKEEFLKHGVTKVHSQRDLAERAEANVMPKDYDLMLYVGYVDCGSPHGIAGFQKEKYYTFYHNGLGGQIGKRIGVSLGSPYLYFDYYAGFECFVNAYSASEFTQRAFVKALYGEIPFNGGEPFKVIPKGMEVNY